MNSIRYIKPIDYNFVESISMAVAYAMNTAKNDNIPNVKIVVNNASYLNVDSHLGQALRNIFRDSTPGMLKNRSISIPQFLANGQPLGITIALANNNRSWPNDNQTICVLVFSTEGDFLKIETELHFTTIELVAVTHTPTTELDVYFGATHAVNLRPETDPNVVPFDVTTLSPDVTTILGRLRSVNISDGASSHYTQRDLKSAIDELREKKLTVLYSDVLGFLVTEVGMPVEDSVELLEKHRKYLR